MKDTLRARLAEIVDVLDQFGAVIEADCGRLSVAVLAQALTDLDGFAARMGQALAGALDECRDRVALPRRPWSGPERS